MRTAALALLIPWIASAQPPIQLNEGQFDGPPYQRVVVDPERDIQTTLAGEFSIAAVGDVVAIRPTSMLQRPQVQAAYDLLREATLAFGNLEQTVAVPEEVAEHNDGHMFQALGRPVIADDLAAVGFDMMNFANNHTTHYGIAGLISTIENMNRVGIVTAGWGRNLNEAKGAKYVDTPNGRVGFLGITTNSFQDARPAGEDQPGAPGANPLPVSRTIHVTQESWDALRAAHASSPHMFPGLYPISSERSFSERGETLSLYQQNYVVGDTPKFSYDIPDAALEDYAREIRNAKFMSDFVVANIHSHMWDVVENPAHAGDESYMPPDFLQELARTAIDNGADAFYSHGEGELRGIEIYKGKPIFYQLGNFTRQPFMQEVFNPEYYNSARRFPFDTDNMTHAEVQGLIYPINHDREYFESIIAVSYFDEGELTEVRLYPIDLKFDGPFVDIGTPHLAEGELATKILTHLQEVSEPFGTEIRISGSIGVIRVN